MANLILPVAPFTREEPYTRHNQQHKAVWGINDQGYAFLHIEEAALDETGLTVRWVPVDMQFRFNRGVCEPITTYWQKELYYQGKFIKEVEGSRTFLETIHPDMIDFTASLGLMILPSMFNGKIRGIDGHDDQPLFDGTGARIADTSYDTTLPPSWGYRNPVAEPEPIAEPTPDPFIGG